MPYQNGGEVIEEKNFVVEKNLLVCILLKVEAMIKEGFQTLVF